MMDPLWTLTLGAKIQAMAQVKKSRAKRPIHQRDEEDPETLAAIDEGLRDAKAGRVVPAEEVRKLVNKWISASSIRKVR
jgi:predicted transcriptional regulator